MMVPPKYAALARQACHATMECHPVSCKWVCGGSFEAERTGYVAKELSG